MKKIKLSIILNLLIVFSALTGLYLTMFGNNFMSMQAFYYYTVQSNIIVLIVSIIFLVLDILLIKGKISKINKTFYLLKYFSTVGISITFLVFTLMLLPEMVIEGYSAYLLTLGNLTVHFLTPILSIISFIISDGNFKSTKTTFLLGTWMTLYYFIFAIILSLISSDGVFISIDGSQSKFAYFFLDYETNGWFTITNNFFGLGVFYWFMIILIMTIILSKIILKLRKKDV